MKLYRVLVPIGLVVLLCGAACHPSAAEDILGTRMGIPTSSPPIFWPAGMSLEALSPNKLYPNGPLFGLTNTSGGFGMMGSGPVSGVGLAQSTVSPLVKEEIERPYVYLRRLTNILESEAAKSRTLFSTTLGGSLRSEMFRPLTPQQSIVEPLLKTTSPLFVPSVDTILRDQPASTDAVLRTGL